MSTYSSDILLNLSDNFIRINNCGELELHQDSHIIRPRGRNDYLLIFVCNGYCYFSDSGEVRKAGSGDIVVFRPQEPQDYLFLKKDSPHNFWIHFSGGICDELFYKLGIGNTHLLHVSHTKYVEYIVKNICKYFHLKTTNYEVICSGLMECLLGMITDRASTEKSDFDDKNSRLISKYISRLKLVPNLKINLDDAASSCNMSKVHFSRTFKSITGIPPHRYIINLRIERAKEMLVYTEESILKISEDVGFNDQNYFCRTFKKATGFTPSEYRKRF